MRARALVLALVSIALSARMAAAGCDPAGADAADVAGARAAIAATCGCTGASSHGSYVRCARDAAKAALTNQSCVGAVVRCAARSTCGRPGAVACCQTRPNGVTRASVKGSAEACRTPPGGSACVSVFESACDACTALGCAVATATPAPTPTPTPQPNVCGNGIVDAGEECDAATCTAVIDGVAVESECGAPGTLHECECRDQQCGFLPGGVLCWDSDECLPQPGPEIGSGRCVPTICGSSSDCSPETPCENGLCCVPVASGVPCRFDDAGFALPCCGAGVCVDGSPFGYCCLPSGESCTGDAGCCSGTCAGGTCS